LIYNLNYYYPEEMLLNRTPGFGNMPGTALGQFLLKQPMSAGPHAEAV
jgi:hypothetical protein